VAVSLHHVNIRALDLELTVAFYVDAIGLAEGFRPPFPFRGAWLYDGERPVVHLTVADSDAASASAEAGVDHIAFACEDLDATLRRLDRLGLRYSPPRAQPATGVRQSFVLDPNGVMVELQGR
jgi:catechol 2,3-dioxygenase-like lactoylglutathione lyase family enzyme